MSKRRISGFTLVEILMTTFIFSLLVGGICLTLTTGWISSGVGGVTSDLNQDLRQMMIWLAEDLRQSGNAAISNVPANGSWYNTITFKTPSAQGVSGGLLDWDSQSISYAIGGTSFSQLLRTYGSAQKILAQNLTLFQVRRQSSTPRVVEVQLQVEKNTFLGRLIVASLDFQVKLRN